MLEFHIKIEKACQQYNDYYNELSSIYFSNKSEINFNKVGIYMVLNKAEQLYLLHRIVDNSIVLLEQIELSQKRQLENINKTVENDYIFAVEQQELIRGIAEEFEELRANNELKFADREGQKLAAFGEKIRKLIDEFYTKLSIADRELFLSDDKSKLNPDGILSRRMSRRSVGDKYY